MVEKKTDRRILKTKRALRESLLYLLKEQPIQKISVSRLCEKSDINRSTFYTYYSSPMDLLESIEDEILNTLEEDMIQFEKENSISQLMNSIIFYISEHKQLVRLLFSDHGDPGFQNKLLLATQHWTMPMWQSRRPDYDAETLSSLHIYIYDQSVLQPIPQMQMLKSETDNAMHCANPPSRNAGSSKPRFPSGHLKILPLVHYMCRHPETLRRLPKLHLKGRFLMSESFVSYFRP